MEQIIERQKNFGVNQVYDLRNDKQLVMQQRKLLHVIMGNI
jgi:hypothetical protein